MKQIILMTTVVFVFLTSCDKKKTSSNNNTNVTPIYVGTYTGHDSIETYNGGTLLATNVYSKSFVVVESSVTGKNAYLLNFQGNDTIQANFANGTITIFGTSSPSIFNFSGTYSANTINYYFEFINTVTQKVYGKYTKQ